MANIFQDRDASLTPKDETVDEFYQVIARNIRNRRKNLDPPVSMERAARYLGVSYQTIYKWENSRHKRIPGPKDLLGLSKLFGCKPSDLYEGVPGM